MILILILECLLVFVHQLNGRRRRLRRRRLRHPRQCVYVLSMKWNYAAIKRFIEIIKNRAIRKCKRCPSERDLRLGPIIVDSVCS